VAGDVEIGEGSSVWFNAVIRGDEGKVVIGRRVNVQDCAVIHSDRGIPVKIGDGVTVGHGAVVRSAEVGDGAMIGMHATVLTGARIGAQSLIGAHSLVTGKFSCPPQSLVWGIPARIVRRLGPDEVTNLGFAVDVYTQLCDSYAKGVVETISGGQQT